MCIPIYIYMYIHMYLTTSCALRLHVPFGYNALVVRHQTSTTSIRVIMSALLNEWGSVIETREGTHSVSTYFYFYL